MRKGLPLHQLTQTGSGIEPTFYRIGSAVAFCGAKATGARSCIFSPSHFSVKLWLIKHRDKSCLAFHQMCTNRKFHYSRTTEFSPTDCFPARHLPRAVTFLSPAEFPVFHSSSHSVQINVGGANHMMNFASDYLFDLVGIGQNRQEVEEVNKTRQRVGIIKQLHPTTQLWVSFPYAQCSG